MASVAGNSSVLVYPHVPPAEECTEEHPTLLEYQATLVWPNTLYPSPDPYIDSAGLSLFSASHYSMRHGAHLYSTLVYREQSLTHVHPLHWGSVVSPFTPRSAPVPPPAQEPDPVHSLYLDGGTTSPVHPPLLTRMALPAAASPDALTPNTLSARPPSSTTLSPTTLPSAAVSPLSEICEPMSDEVDIQAQVGTYNFSAKRKQAVSGISQHGSSTDKRRKRVRASKSRSDVLHAANGPKITTKRDSSGKIVGSESVFGADQVVRVAPSLQQKKATSETRKVGACERCRRSRKRCDRPAILYHVCNECMSAAANVMNAKRPPKHQYQPCLRLDILDLRLHRKGPTADPTHSIWMKKQQELLRREKKSDTHDLYLSQGFGEGEDYWLPVTVSSFKPTNDGRTKYFWTPSSSKDLKSFEVPPYFISDLEGARQSLRTFVKRNVQTAYFEKLLAKSNPLVLETFKAALEHANSNQSQIIPIALHYWVAARLIEDQWRVVKGGEDIGLHPQDGKEHPWRDFAPVTPVMDTQLDDLVIRDLLKRLSKGFLETLKSEIDKRKRENWPDIYFALFIMMSNTGWTIRDMKANADWKGLKTGCRGGNLTQGFIHACKSMLAYFHFVCGGSLPLSLVAENRHKRHQENCPLSSANLEYLEFVQSEISRQEEIRNWKEVSMYKDTSYWCYQLLCPKWEGDLPHIEMIDDYREEDFLSSSTR